MKYRVANIFLLLFFALYGGMGADTLPPDNVSVVIHSSQTTPTIGDSLSVFCTVTLPEDYHAGEPYILDKQPFLDINQYSKKKEIPGSGIIREQYGFLTYVVSPDTLTLGPFVVDYTTADGKTGTVKSNTLTLIVRGVVANPKSPKPPPPKPNRAPFEISSRGIPLWLYALAALLMVIAIGVLVYHRRKKKAPATITPHKPIDEIEEFERIRSMKLHEKGKIRELYIMISDAMRGFIHRNMKFDALYETTEEIMTHLSGDSLDTSIINLIREVFYESDMVKFAKFIPSAELSSSIIDRALKPVKIILENIEREKERLTAEQIPHHPSMNKGYISEKKDTVKHPGGNG